MGKADLPQQLVTFSAGFPIYSLGKPAGRVANGNQVIGGGAAATGHKYQSVAKHLNHNHVIKEMLNIQNCKDQS